MFRSRPRTKDEQKLRLETDQSRAGAGLRSGDLKMDIDDEASDRLSRLFIL